MNSAMWGIHDVTLSTGFVFEKSFKPLSVPNYARELAHLFLI
jgi:hypothetical protein